MSSGRSDITDVYLYGTCVVDSFFPEAGVDAIEILEHLGIRVHFPQEQSCCGQPAYTSGYVDQARTVAAAQLACFKHPWPVVILSGSCGGMIKHHYVKIFDQQHPLHEKAKQVADRTFEFTEFLVDVLAVNPEQLGLSGNTSKNESGPAGKVVLHTSCAARREMNTLATGRAVVQEFIPEQLIEQPYEAECCGFGGTFSVRHGDISGAMVTDKCNNIEKSGADRLVSADCACLLNINGRMAKQNSKLQGEHLATALNRAMKSAGGVL